MEYKFDEIFNIPELLKLCKSFTQINGTATALLDLEGKVYISTGWQEVCTLFHRKHPACKKACTESDTVLANKAKENNRYNMYKCKNGLIDIAIPIYLKNEHIGNFFTGQFFLEPPDTEYFRKQAKQLGFDEQEYLSAVEKVPVFSENEIKKSALFLANLTEHIGETGLKEIQNKENTRKLRDERKKYKSLFDQANDAIILFFPNGTIFDANESACKLFNFSKKEILGKTIIDLSPDKQYNNKNSADKAKELIEFTLNDKPQQVEWLYCNKTGNKIDTSVSLNKIKLSGEIYLQAIIHVITEQKKNEEAIRKSEKKYRLLFENITSSFALQKIIYDKKGNAVDYLFIEVNPVFEKYVNMPASSIIGKTAKELFPNTEDHWIQLFDKVARTREPKETIMYSKEFDKYFEAFVFYTQKDHCAAIFNDVTNRVKNEEILNKFKASIEYSLDAVYWINNESGFDYVNERACKMLGYSHEELIHLKINDIDPVVPKDNFKTVWNNLLNNKKNEVFAVESKHKKKDGTIFPVELNSVFVWKNNKGLLISYAKDISERKEHEVSILKNQKLLNDSQKAGKIGSWEYYIETKELIWNEQVYDIFGIKNSIKVNYQVFIDLVYPDDRAYVEQKFQESLKKGIFPIYEFRIVRPDKTLRYVKIFGNIENSQNNKPYRTYGIIQDITEQKKTEENLAKSELKQESIFRVVPAGIGVVIDRIIVEANPQLCKLTGYKKEELIGKSARILYPTEDEYLRVGNVTNKLNYGKGKNQIETVWKRKNKNLIDIYLASTPIDPADKSKGITFTALDITERKRNEKALEKRVLALTQPLDDIGSIEITDLFNIKDLQKIQDTFAKATGVATLITTPDGIPITKPGNFTDFCNKIRCTEIGEIKCKESDAQIGKNNPEENNIQPCLSSGLWNAGAAINVGGIHVANWLIGQVRNEHLDEEEIFNYADQLKLDRDEYCKAYYKVPTMPLEQFKHVAEALNNLASELAIKAYQNVQQARFIAKQKETEKQLLKAKKLSEENEQRYKMLHDASFGGIFIHKNQIILDCNQGLTDITGYSRDELIGKNGLILVKKEYADKITSYIKKGNRNSFEIVGVRKNGEEYPLRIDARNISYKGGEVRSVEFRDITEQKNIEAEIVKAKVRAEESEFFLKESQLAGNVGSYSLNVEKGIWFTTETLDAIYGINESYEKSVKGWFDIIHPDDKKDLKKYFFDEVIGKKQPFNREFRIIRNNDGETRWVRGIGKYHYNKKKKFTQILGTVQDITQIKNTEKELIKAKEKAEENEYFLHESQRSANIGSYKMDIKTGYWISTETLNQIFGIDYTYDKNVSGWLNIVHPEDREKMGVYLQNKVFGKKQPFNYEYRIVRVNDKTVRWLHGQGKLYSDNNGNLSYMLGTIQDITERKLLEEESKMMNIELEKRVNERTDQLQQANKDLESFAYSVSHDLRAPIRHIDGFTHLLEKAIQPLDSKAQNYIDKISLSSKNMSTMIDELLQFSRVGRTSLKKKQVNLSNIVRDIITNFKPDYTGRGIKWDIKKLPEVYGDPALLKIAFENIISNAIKYTSKRDQAIIEIGQKENCGNGEVCIFIKDNGAGFDMAYKDKLFGVFQRLHKNEEFEGIGIGLANVKQIITKHNGLIDAESEINKGATFYIRLPKLK